ncbi:hypothetical protein E2562_029650 [Oryza meyeriana var. granulata]|uniref:Uncharacterized protein n=1 Tax=Oryza meyeriana var. granulata TaxID=110450 RepID=A0A6G1C1K7_9ORYZ|nr:hypothetical protein E2562_029650 [Oryza meyeriana var. granulata]
MGLDRRSRVSFVTHPLPASIAGPDPMTSTGTILHPRPSGEAPAGACARGCDCHPYQQLIWQRKLRHVNGGMKGGQRRQHGKRIAAMAARKEGQ